MSEFQFPSIVEGDDVMISRDPSRSDLTYAKVIKVKPNAKAIDVMLPGGVKFEQLWHKDDPRIKTENDKFKDSVSGVFVLCQTVNDRHSLLARMDEMEKQLAAVKQYVFGDSTPQLSSELPPNVAQSQESAGSSYTGRPRGRPRLNPLPAEAAV